MAINERWLPEGHVWDLHIDRRSIGSDLSFTGGGWKLCWHTTESSWLSFDSIDFYFRHAAKGKAPHVLIGGSTDATHPRVAQYIPFDESAFALANDPSDAKQTNRANTIQVEVCGRAANMGEFQRYRALANLAALIMHRVDIPNWTHAVAGVTPVRWSDSTWVEKQGHVGHNMAPDNDHTDPGTNFRWGTLQNLIAGIPDGGYDL